MGSAHLLDGVDCALIVLSNTIDSDSGGDYPVRVIRVCTRLPMSASHFAAPSYRFVAALSSAYSLPSGTSFVSARMFRIAFFPPRLSRPQASLDISTPSSHHLTVVSTVSLPLLIMTVDDYILYPNFIHIVMERFGWFTMSPTSRNLCGPLMPLVLLYRSRVLFV